MQGRRLDQGKYAESREQLPNTDNQGNASTITESAIFYMHTQKNCGVLPSEGTEVLCIYNIWQMKPETIAGPTIWVFLARGQNMGKAPKISCHDEVTTVAAAMSDIQNTSNRKSSVDFVLLASYIARQVNAS